MTTQTFDVDGAAERLDGSHPAEILEEALGAFTGELSVSFSGAEDVVLVEMASKIAARTGAEFRVFTLDTGRLHEETLRFLEKVRDTYDVPIDAFFPRPEAVQALVREKGLFSFYRDGHQECCGIRKVEPLKRALADARAYVTGQRKDQSPGTRAMIPVVQLDPAFSADPEQPLVKFNPLGNWSSAQVWHRRASGALQPAARSGLQVDRLRSLYASHQPRRARARRPLVVGRGHQERVWPARDQSGRPPGHHALGPGYTTASTTGTPSSAAMNQIMPRRSRMIQWPAALTAAT